MADLRPLLAEISRSIAERPRAATDEMRTLRRDFSKRIASLSGEDVIELAIELAKRLAKLDTFWYRYFAYELLQKHKTAPKLLDIEDLHALGEGMDDWADVDTFSTYVAGPAWRNEQIEDAHMEGWVTCPNRWWRRAALVATVPLNSKTHGGKGDPTRTLRICELAIDDRDDMVVKALSWALRELAKRDAGAVDAFLKQHSSRLAPRVVREVSHKLTHGTKNPRRLAAG
jgi:3-methyladenine DNA glycosylase AlkD